jgi:hypothetical protein
VTKQQDMQRFAVLDVLDASDAVSGDAGAMRMI